MGTGKLVRATRNALQDVGETSWPVAEIVDWIAGAKDRELWRINAFQLASDLQTDDKQLLEIFIHLVHDGVMDLNWDFHCTSCNAVAQSHHHLKDAGAQDHCPLCKADFKNTLDQNVEVTFTPAENLYTVSERFLADQRARTAELHARKAIPMPARYVSGLDCLHIPLFHDLFEHESLSLTESLQIRHVAIMFTDIKGSTALYDRLGDSAAYSLVRDHFEILFRVVREHGGIIVKTIGDAVMASFKRAADGAAASVAIQKAFEAFNRKENIRGQVLVKIGLHAGKTIAVNLNNRVDYFGQTVNMAARIQSTARGGEAIISQAVRSDRDAIRAVSGAVKSLTRMNTVLKGIQQSQMVYRLNAVEKTPDNAVSNRLIHASTE